MADDNQAAGSGGSPPKGKKKRRTKASSTSSRSTAKTDTPTASSDAPVTAAGGGGDSAARGLGWGAVVLALLALGAAGYAWYQTAVNARLSGGEQNNRLQMMEQRVADVNASQADVDSLVDQVRQRLADAETGIAEQVSAVKQLVGATESALLGQISELRQQVADNEARAESRTQALQQRLDEAAQSLDGRHDGFRQEFDSLTASIEDLHAELGTSVEQWNMREVEHLLVIANQRASLGQDARGARAALQLADQRLEDLGDPAMLPVRESLSREIAALDAVQPVDYAGVTNTLSLLSTTLADLPLRGVTGISGPVAATESNAAAADGADDGGILGVGKAFLADIGGLVQVEKDGEPVVPPLSPEIRQMIIERGKLILEGAQVALMRAQPVVYQDRLDAAAQWIHERFVDDDEQVVRWLEQLEGLKSVDPEVEMPDISGSLSALRGVMGGA